MGAGIYLSTQYIADHYLTSGSESKQCQVHGVAHQAIIKSGDVTPEHTSAKLCDTLTITNKDTTIRIIAFGKHDHHQAYDNITEKVLGKDQSLTITLNRSGSYIFHDHDQETVAGSFTVDD